VSPVPINAAHVLTPLHASHVSAISTVQLATLCVSLTVLHVYLQPTVLAAGLQDSVLLANSSVLQGVTAV